MSALALSQVRAAYASRAVLDDASASFATGKVTGIVGPNGAGKTTLLRVALGLLPIEAGDVTALGRSLKECSREWLARSIAYLPQENAVQWPMLVERIVALGRIPHGARDDGAAAIADAMGRCDVSQFAARRLNELSAGERARVLLARALATQAPILLVDEPAAHLDPAHQLQLMELLRAEAARGVAVVITLHDLSLASRFCDEIVMLRNGHVAGQGAPGEVLCDAALAKVFGIAAKRLDGNVVPWSRV
ncbi:MAG: ABC transporter ATP-binding protein [Proteobacteria bacterium]|nr:ABC transporter ATP-binding protein [Pseudomonadota bacterium]